MVWFVSLGCCGMEWTGMGIGEGDRKSDEDDEDDEQDKTYYS